LVTARINVFVSGVVYNMSVSPAFDKRFYASEVILYGGHFGCLATIVQLVSVCPFWAAFQFCQCSLCRRQICCRYTSAMLQQQSHYFCMSIQSSNICHVQMHWTIVNIKWMLSWIFSMQLKYSQ